MRFAYADPPYLGCGSRYIQNHPDALAWDDIATHRGLIAQLAGYDAWALSASSPSLSQILPMCPDDVRVAAWVKPFAAFKPNVNPAYAWEPVIFRGARRGDRKRATVRDWCSANITLKKGLTGAKPEAFALWIFDLLGAEATDTFEDLFPGTGIMGRAWSRRAHLPLFAAPETAA